MRFFSFSLLALPLMVTASPHRNVNSGAKALPRDNYTHGNSSLFAGFQNAEFTSSQGGHATCISGTIPVTVSAINTHLNFPTGFPANQTVVTQAVLSDLSVNSTLRASISGPPTNISDTYGIYSRLCYPTGGSPNASLIQLLTHGAGFDIRYWDVYNEEYSYIDAAAKKGYTTLSSSRLGTGLSDHPDPVQAVQYATQVEILHTLVNLLRSGSLASTAFKHVVAVGHSFGSQLSSGVSYYYPSDFEALVLTGFSIDMTGIPLFLTGLDFSIASEIDPSRFGGRPNGYVVSATKSGNQFSFFHSPGFAPELLDAAEVTKDTAGLGELFSFGVLPKVPAYTGPVFVQLGEFELPSYAGNCTTVGDMAALGSDLGEVTVKSLYPNAAKGGAWQIISGMGHAINFHYGAADAYAKAFEFIAGSGL